MQDLPAPLAGFAAWPQFVVWIATPKAGQSGKYDKWPIHWQTGKVCNAHDPVNWTTAPNALAAHKKFDKGYGSGVGFVFTDNDPFFFLDIDHCMQADDTCFDYATALCNRFMGACIETSHSGKGLHVFGQYSGTVIHSKKNLNYAIELYTEKRFAALTGICATGDVNQDCTDALRAVADEYFPDRSVSSPPQEWTAGSAPGWTGTADDDALIERARASSSRDPAVVFGGELGVSFDDLWTANEEALGRKWPHDTNPFDRSSADLALASRLARLTENNCERVEYLMRRSALFREKWDRADYLRRTILKACAAAPSEGETPSKPISHTSLPNIIFDGDVELAPPRELVKGVLPFSGVAFIGGQSGAGKTFIAVHLAVSLAAAGQSRFFNRLVKERVGVAIIAAEGAGTLPPRIEAAKRGLGITENLPIATVTSVADLSVPGAIEALATDLAGVAKRMHDEFGVRLGAIVIDTVAAAFSLQEENSNAEAAGIVRKLQLLSLLTGALALPVHHYGKSADSGLRGASAFRAGADAVISVLAVRNENEATVTGRSVTLAKSRTAEEGPISAFELHLEIFGRDEDGEPFGACRIVEGGTVFQKPRRTSSNSHSYQQTFDELIEVHGVERSDLSPGQRILAISATILQLETSRSQGSRRGSNILPESERKALTRFITGSKGEFQMARADGQDWVWRR